MKYSHLFKNEMRNIFRDKILMMLFVYPFAVLGILYYIKELIIDNPANAHFLPILPIMGYILSPMISGMVIAFIFLDEKDDNVWSVLRIMPVNKNKFVLMRFIFPVVLSFVCIFPIPWIIDVFEIPLYVNLLLSIMGGLQSVILALIICLKAKNKVEGFAMVKILGMLMMLPVFSIMINSNWEYLFAIIPTYWSYKPLIGLVMQETWVNLVLSLGFMIHVGLSIVLLRLFLTQMANE